MTSVLARLRVHGPHFGRVSAYLEAAAKRAPLTGGTSDAGAAV
ncbi:hypothetical protein [Streptomyces sp. NPDC004232]